MVHLISSTQNLKVFILKKNHQIIDNNIKFNEKLNIVDHNIYENNLLPIEDVYIVNFDKVYNNGYKNGNR